MTGTAILGAVIVTLALLQSNATAAPGWTQGEATTGTTTWRLASDDSAGTLEVVCQESSRAAVVNLVTKESLLNIADGDGEIEFRVSFDGGKMEGRSTHIAKGYHGLVVSKGGKELKRLLEFDGKPMLIRVEGHGHELLLTFPLSGGRAAKLGGPCAK